ncbi:hypothetical protein [Allorhizocola rhizosphaerae]|uniref:hypothetical protein n=1 Tax=Allorhizocola rhizosphaerae TaxID=1872709 RepID=UPI000E3C62D8|nr:hypothetical protein [Allorhizocola rhizosphaerae]
MRQLATQHRTRSLVRRLATGLVAVGVTIGGALVAAEPAHAVDSCRILTSVSNQNAAFHWGDCRTTSPHANYFYIAYVNCFAPNRAPAYIERTGGVWLNSKFGGWSKAYCEYHETRQYYGIYKRSSF